MMKKANLCVILLAAWLASVSSAFGAEKKTTTKAAPPLPLPKANIPAMPPLEPAVVTASGQRLLLNQTNVQMRYDPATGKLIVNKPNWWVIDFPLTRIQGLEGKSADQIAQLLFHKPADQVRNWYVMTPASPSAASPAEPAVPTGPAPINLTPHPTLTVNASNPKADDANPGTAQAPLKTISAAIAKAKAGDVIHIMPGVYRESVKITQSGTADKPIRIEGVRGKDGRMPVITGNDPFPKNAWKPVKGLEGVWRANAPGKGWGTVSVAGNALVEASVPASLKPGEFCLNRASKKYLAMSLGAGAPSPNLSQGEGGFSAGEAQQGQTWRKVTADQKGVIDLAKLTGSQAKAANAVFWLSTWVWLEPQHPKKWDPAKPETTYHRMTVAGPFRAGRMTGTAINSQVNKFRVWVNGKALPAVAHPGPDENMIHQPRPWRGYGFSGRYDDFPLKEGWNHLVFELDTTSKPKPTKHGLTFSFGDAGSYHAVKMISSVTAPSDRAKAPAGEPQPFVTQYLMLGPFAAGEPDRGVYVRLNGDRNPNEAPLDIAARGSQLVDIEGDFVQVRGLEIRDGRQFQQRAQVALKGQGDLLEGCLMRDSEYGGVSFNVAKMNQKSAPIVIRGNWILNPGDVGISGSGDKSKLTAANENGLIPGYGRLLIGYNRIVNNNADYFSPYWEAGGMKMFWIAGSVIRYNTIVGGSGGGIWFDSGAFNNRIEGNAFLHAYTFGVGLEAAPGPNLVANTLCVDLRAGGVWFRAGILGWDSMRSWAVNNTIDGGWNTFKGWQNYVGTEGIKLSGRGGMRTYEPWHDPSIKKEDRYMRGEAYVNNLIVGVNRTMPKDDYVHKPDSPTALAVANYTDKGKGAAKPLPAAPAFRDTDAHDYRLKPDSPLNHMGATNRYTKLVRHDFNGLLRFPGDGQSVGAFRAVPSLGTSTVIEVEWRDGTMKRFE